MIFPKFGIHDRSCFLLNRLKALGELLFKDKFGILWQCGLQVKAYSVEPFSRLF